MGRTNLTVRMLAHSPRPEEIVALGAKLCYSSAGLDKLQQGVQVKEQGDFINKLMEMGHQSPLEHASFTFAAEGVSRSLLAQITRHRIASFSVQSQRYVSEHSAKSADGVFDYIIPPRIAELGEEYVKTFEEQMRAIQEYYDYWLKLLDNSAGQAAEDARYVLPNAAETKLIVTMNARELLHFFSLRCCNRAQWEIREMAEAMLKEVQKVAPHIFGNGGPPCVGGACPEGKMSCGKAAEMKKKYKL